MTQTTLAARRGAARQTSTRPVIGLHLDLKGVAFRPNYVPQLMKDLAGQRVNMVLVEYEDVFPFDGIDIAYDPQTKWTRRMLANFQAEAAKNGIEVVPLQQCLGHLEYVYGWKKYRSHAEDQQYPSTLALGNRKGKELILNMLRQVIEGHPDSRYVHLGMDEAHGLNKASQRLGRDVLDLFLEHLGELCDVVESYGKTPVIWSDMLEDHFRPDAFERFKGRVVLMTWEYGRVFEKSKVGRLAGFRVSRKWLDEPDNPAAPAVSPSTTFIEDYPADIRKVVRPYLNGREFQPLFQIDIWTKLGFRVIAASAVRASAHGGMLPNYNTLLSNVRAWSAAVKRTNQLGQLATSWARGTSWCPPNFSIDLTWPIIHEMSKTMGARPEPFWPGIPQKTVDRIIKTLGRCKEDWRLEGKLAEEMERLSPSVKAHHYEWDGLALMARVLELQRRASFSVEEMDYFHANHRPAEPEWQRRIDEQRYLLKALPAMRDRVRKHFGKRYYGEAFEEWLRFLFGLSIGRITGERDAARRKFAEAKRTYRLRSSRAR